MLDLIKGSLDDDKAEDLVVIDLAGKSTLGDYMVVASGRSQRQVAAMAEAEQSNETCVESQEGFECD